MIESKDLCYLSQSPLVCARVHVWRDHMLHVFGVEERCRVLERDYVSVSMHALTSTYIWGLHNW